MRRQIIKHPNRILRMKSKTITEFTPRLKTLAKDMVETMRHANGVGLAAIQVAEPIRMMVMDERYDKPDKGEAVVLLNPEILRFEGSEVSQEGCLSCPGEVKFLDRPTEVQVRFHTLDGEQKEAVFLGIFARCIYQEIEHMNGGLIIDKKA
jgi:peptide deformylase